MTSLFSFLCGASTYQNWHGYLRRCCKVGHPQEIFSKIGLLPSWPTFKVFRSTRSILDLSADPERSSDHASAYPTLAYRAPGRAWVHEFSTLVSFRIISVSFENMCHRCWELILTKSRKIRELNRVPLCAGPAHRTDVPHFAWSHEVSIKVIGTA